MDNKSLCLGLMLLTLSTLNLGANPFIGSDEQPQAPTTKISQGSPLPQFLVDIQAGFRAQTADLINQWKVQPSMGILLGLLLATFIYGLIHALGPGHRKSVVFSLFLGNRAPFWKPIAAGFLSAGIHAGSAIALIFILSIIQAGVARLFNVEQTSRWIEFISALALLGMAITLLGLKIRDLIRHSQHTHGGPLDKKKGIWFVVISTSIIPCPGATMVLLLSIYAGLPWLGVLGVLSMSLGMGIVVSGAGLLAWAGNSALFSRLKKNPQRMETISTVMEMVSYSILLILALLML